jgi:peptidoglycan DL-endopeptidase CwlO
MGAKFTIVGGTAIAAWLAVYGAPNAIASLTSATPPAVAPASATATAIAAKAIGYAHGQLGKPYLWAATGPDSFDCSGLMMAAYHAAGLDIPRTSQAQYAWGPKIPAGQEQPGDLVFFAGSDGTVAAPGHVGLVIGNGLMIEAYGSGYAIRVASYTNRNPVGFTRPTAYAAVS